MVSSSGLSWKSSFMLFSLSVSWFFFPKIHLSILSLRSSIETIIFEGVFFLRIISNNLVPFSAVIPRSPLLRAGSIAAFAIEKDNEEKLVIVIEARAKKDVDWLNVVKDIKDSVLKSHNIIADTIVLIKPRTIFKTSSGKIRRNATKQAFFDNTLEVIFDSRNSSSQIVDNNQENEKIETPKQTVVANSGEIVNLLVEKLSEELKISKNEIDLNAPFTSFGLDSAKSVQLVGQLEEIVGKELEATILWNYPSINKLADFLSNNNVQASQESISEKKSDSDLTDEDINKMTDEEAEALLLKKLNSDDLDI